MAMIKCHECGEKVSSKAKTCPSCGVKPKAKTSKLTWVVAAIMAVFIYKMIDYSGTHPVPARQSEPEVVKAPPTAEELRTKEIRKQFSSWDGSHRNFERIIKRSMNDPSSYEHVETRYVDNGDSITVVSQFRGANSFGGIVVNNMAAKFSLDGTFIEIIK